MLWKTIGCKSPDTCLPHLCLILWKASLTSTPPCLDCFGSSGRLSSMRFSLSSFFFFWISRFFFWKFLWKQLGSCYTDRTWHELRSLLGFQPSVVNDKLLLSGSPRLWHSLRMISSYLGFPSLVAVIHSIFCAVLWLGASAALSCFQSSPAINNCAVLASKQALQGHFSGDHFSKSSYSP